MRRSNPEDFWKRTKIEGECWIWTGSVMPNGYGQVFYQGKHYRTHQLAFYLTNGYIPLAGRGVCHSCDETRCCNPNHLYDGNQKENVMDSRIHGKRSESVSREVKIKKFGMIVRRDEQTEFILKKHADGMTMREIGERTGLTLSGVSRIINGNRRNGSSTIYKNREYYTT